MFWIHCFCEFSPEIPIQGMGDSVLLCLTVCDSVLICSVVSSTVSQSVCGDHCSTVRDGVLLCSVVSCTGSESVCGDHCFTMRDGTLLCLMVYDGVLLCSVSFSVPCIDISGENSQKQCIQNIPECNVNCTFSVHPQSYYITYIIMWHFQMFFCMVFNIPKHRVQGPIIVTSIESLL